MINKEEFELTEEGKQKLELELEDLTTNQRTQNINALQEARAQGDLSENADYDAAKEDQRRIESRILEITNILKHVKIIKKDSSSKVSTGKKVAIKYLETNKEVTCEIVGTIEADPFANKISNDSPLGRGILGKEVSDTVLITTETGREFRVQILAIE